MKTMKAIVVTDQAAGTAMQLPILVTACRSRVFGRWKADCDGAPA
jgi:hypothetical protein